MSTVRERDFSRNLEEEEGTGRRVSEYLELESWERYRRAVLAEALRLLL